MKVAVYEPFPRMCGVTKWTFEVAQGFRSLGHEADVVSFTLSGRARVTNKQRRAFGSIGGGWHWWPEKPDRTEKYEDAAAVLDEYDLIVLNEPKNGTIDRDTKRLQTELPKYAEVLAKTKTPWMTILHAPQYDKKRAPYLDRVLEAGNFTGVVIEHQGKSYESGAWAFDGRIKLVQPWPWLPYSRHTEPSTVQRGWKVGLGGRMTPNKGSATLAYVSDGFPSHLTTHLFGTESGGAAPASSYFLWEALTKNGNWRGVRRGEQTEPDEWGNYGDKIYCWPWWVAQENELGNHIIEFTAGYDNQFDAWAECAIGVNLTGSNFAVGLEYTSLEAMDAGCAIILPAYSLERTGSQQYAATPLEKYSASITIDPEKGFRTHKFDPEVGQELVEAVRSVDQTIRDGGHDPKVNWKALDDYHDPQFLAGKILELTA